MISAPLAEWTHSTRFMLWEYSIIVVIGYAGFPKWWERCLVVIGLFGLGLFADTLGQDVIAVLLSMESYQLYKKGWDKRLLNADTPKQ